MSNISMFEDEIVEYLKDMAERGDQKAKTLLSSLDVEDDRKCFNCGDTAYPETGFIFQDELYCEDCCPEKYGE